jgi:hypothetical protein
MSTGYISGQGHFTWRYLNHPQRATSLWLGRHCVLVAWLGLLLALACPPHGTGISVCWFQAVTGVPCPGCGMTRSLSCGLRGMFADSWHYHPMGLPILVLFIFTAGQSLLRRIHRERIAAFLQDRAAFFNLCYLGFTGTFVIFGTVRALLHWKDIWL